MRVSGFTRYAFVSACVGAAMLSGCAGSRSSISAPGAMPQNCSERNVRRSWQVVDTAGG